jgi:N-acetylglucosaminyldiphosphoundecaprenol N-acetyl-beta-D-mannosaminyltransferase
MRSASASAAFVADVAPPGGAGAEPAERVEFLGLPFCLVTQAQVIDAVIQAIAADSGAPYRYVVTPNSYHVVSVHDDPARLLPLYRDAWLSLCDSRIVRALARLRRRMLPLVTGSDLVAALLATLNNQGGAGLTKRILVVGPPRSTEALLRAAYPHVTFEVLPAPGALSQNAELRLAVARACLTRRWDIALLCVGCPAQELIARQLIGLGCKSGVALCVGASIDFLIGARARAPLWLRKLSLEWAYRLAQEPGRLWRRYLVESPKILRIFMATRPPRRS